VSPRTEKGENDSKRKIKCVLKISAINDVRTKE
jgi:hypothetical protein